MATLVCYVKPVGDINIPEAGTEVNVNPQGVKHDWYPGKVVSRQLNDDGVIQSGFIQLDKPIITDDLDTEGNFQCIVENLPHRSRIEFGGGKLKFSQPISIDKVIYILVEGDDAAPMFIGVRP